MPGWACAPTFTWVMTYVCEYVCDSVCVIRKEMCETVCACLYAQGGGGCVQACVLTGRTWMSVWSDDVTCLCEQLGEGHMPGIRG